MTKSFKILEVDVTDRTKSAGKETVEITDFIGQLVKKRKFNISDNDASISPFSVNGLLFKNNWRNQDAEYLDDSNQIQFKGAIKVIGQTIGNSGNVVDIDAAEGVGPLMDGIIESNDATSHLGFRVNNASGYSPGDQTIQLKDGTTQIPVPSLVTFEADLVPRYQVVAAVGNPTTQITLDRPLEKFVNDNDGIRVSVPVYKSAAKEIKDTLKTIGLGSKLGSSFDTINDFDVANNYLFFINVIIEQRVSVANHIGKLLELSNMFLSVSDSGIIDIVRGLSYGGEPVDSNYLSADEIIPEIKLSFNDTNLLFNYNLLYLSGGEVRVAKDEADPVYVQQFANIKSWNPISQSGSVATEYNYLFANATSANYFGHLMLDYYSVPRAEAIFQLKGFYHNQPLNFINLRIAKQYFVSFKVTENNYFYDEPARIMGYARDLDNQKYTNVRVQFSNYLLPNIIRDITGPIFPTVLLTFNINEGAAVVIEDIRSQILFVELYDLTKTLIITQQKSKANGQLTLDPIGDYFQIKSDSISNSNTYYFKLYTKSGNNFSEKTDFIQFVPAVQTAQIGFLKVGVFTIS